jgi:capsular polysaccharide export protein
MAEPFLRMPPFPGSRAKPLTAAGGTAINDEQALELVRLMKSNRVGGNFWGSQPALPDGRDVVLAPSSRAQAFEMLETAGAEGLLNRCMIIDWHDLEVIDADIPTFTGNFDCWHISTAAAELWVDPDHELALVAALAERPIRIFGQGLLGGVCDTQALARMVGQAVSGRTYACPFSGEAITPAQAIEQLSDWRRLIDRNRSISAAYGIASWKRRTVDPMLWDGSSLPRHASSVPKSSRDGSVMAAWKSRTPATILDRIAEVGLPVAEIEDGMIRGRGLGANCVPPLSIVVDFSGIYFDPAQSSDLERILQTADMDEALLGRAARLRRTIIEAGISKYDGGSREKPKSGSGRRILVLGQVEDDRSVLNGGPGQTNLGLLLRARQLEPDAWLIYRPHPDVEAGHRKGHIADHRVLDLANEIDRGGSIASLIEAVDGVHCITSLGGFEALLRGKQVTTHGVPFYAGWGLTIDLGPIPSRRTRQRSLDELVAATLILYPTYFDPVTQLPCPPEILVSRIARGEDSFTAPLAWLRSSQGKLKVALRRMWEAAA